MNLSGDAALSFAAELRHLADQIEEGARIIGSLEMKIHAETSPYHSATSRYPAQQRMTGVQLSFSVEIPEEYRAEWRKENEG